MDKPIPHLPLQLLIVLRIPPHQIEFNCLLAELAEKIYYFIV